MQRYKTYWGEFQSISQNIILFLNQIKVGGEEGRREKEGKRQSNQI
jgi:hypothetical protein